jgi:hypothetical protein
MLFGVGLELKNPKVVGSPALIRVIPKVMGPVYPRAQRADLLGRALREGASRRDSLSLYKFFFSLGCPEGIFLFEIPRGYSVLKNAALPDDLAKHPGDRKRAAFWREIS